MREYMTLEDKLAETWEQFKDEFRDRLEDAFYKFVDNLREYFAILIDAIKDIVNRMTGKYDFDERTNFGETEDCYWVWDIHDNQLAYIYGDYYFNERRVRVKKDKQGEVVSFEYID